MRDLPKTVELSVIEVVECDPPADVEPLHWYLLTTHEIDGAALAWQIVNWYKKRWTIEQFFRILKTQGLQIEDSRVETADRLLKLTAIAAKAAVITLQLVQARDGQGAEPASTAFNGEEIRILDALGQQYQGRTKLQSNPHPPGSLAWARLDHRQARWLGRISAHQAGPHNNQSWAHLFSRRRPGGQVARRYVNQLA
jgi:hypothetical protein